ncbi:MAG: hypothetical protein RQ751_08610 [Longimicrobiales bacterium]|nr:hypothetical protein [Longimicrobiales bacterium]
MTDPTVAKRIGVRLILADGGDFLVHDVALPTPEPGRYERLVDWLREDPAVLAELHVDAARLVAAHLLDTGA